MEGITGRRTGSSLIAAGTLLAVLALVLVPVSTAHAAIGAPIDLGATEGDSSLNQPSLSLTTTATAPAGSSIVVTATVGGSTLIAGANCSDSAGHPYVIDAATADPSPDAMTIICSTHQIPTALGTGSTLTVSWNTAGSASHPQRIHAFAVTGLAAAPLDRTAWALGISTSPSSGAAAATTQPDELLVGAIRGPTTASSAGFSPGTNGTANNCAATGTPTYTALAGVGTIASSLFTIHCTVTATGSYAAQGSFGSASPWFAVLATYRAAPPRTRITKKPGRKKKHKRRGKRQKSTFRFEDDLPGVTFLCKLDNGPFTPCTSPKVYRNLKDGKHTFTVKSRDAAGNESVPQVVRFRVGPRKKSDGFQTGDKPTQSQ